MAFAVTRLPGKPIVLVTLDVPLENYTSNLRVIHTYLVHLVTETQGPLHIWFDLRNVNISFCDILIAADEIAHAPRTCFPGAQVALIGTHPLITVGIRRMTRDYKIDLDHFATLEDAFGHMIATNGYPKMTGPAHAG
jgi:hypothetical protein